jgi:hypothetical protein
MRDRLWSVQEGGQDDVGEVPADTREMMTLKNGDFCISPEKVHSAFPRAFVVMRIDYQNFEFIAYRETALFMGKGYQKVYLLHRASGRVPFYVS